MRMTTTTKTTTMTKMTTTKPDGLLADFLRWREEASRKVSLLLEEKFEQLRVSNNPPAIINLLNAMEHTVKSGGKRLRPLLALAAASAVGGREEEALPGALAAELIHTYSLIHDDLPALDDDDTRRGSPSCHKLYGVDVAILAGDALQSLAFQTLAESANSKPTYKRVSKALKILTRATGPLTLVGGQAMDLAFERSLPSLKDSSKMAILKTGELMAASMCMGATLGGAKDFEIKRFRRAGLLAGEAFQIVDDLFNLEGDAAVLGKAVGTDAKRGKITLVTILGANEARKKAESLKKRALRKVAVFRSYKLNFLLDFLTTRTF
jgi:geranylgeranyl diphosphate synthase type II